MSGASLRVGSLYERNCCHCPSEFDLLSRSITSCYRNDGELISTSFDYLPYPHTRWSFRYTALTQLNRK
jgi:hypothetical protein